ncbi:MAG TPA: undecaprenyldiphospho-muramoylpentapeptide beta-N-acetylglucosaminyltransferase [Thermoanaerobaculia bacterium]
MEEATYVIAAGGTGGHIFPGIALAREILARRPEARVVFVGASAGLETRLLPAAGFAVETVSASGFAGKRLGARMASLAAVPRGVAQARRLLRRLRPRAVAGVGGYASVPVVLAAASLGIPTLVHESNARPGIANRLLARFATRVAVGSEAAAARLPGRPVVTGNPLRPEFLEPSSSSDAARAGTARRVLLLGGSQGSAALNRAMTEAARALGADGLEVLHQTGEKWLEPVRAAYGGLPAGWRLEAFLPRPFDAMAWCDLAVCRSGALTLAELSAAGRPAVLVPLATSTHGHQLENAREVERAGAAVVLQEKDLTGDSLAAAIRALLADPARLRGMGAAALRRARPSAARELAEILFSIERARAAA